MTGPEHYQAAELCLSNVDDDSAASMALIAEAQVHATLAAAAATALCGTSEMTTWDWEAWQAAAGTPQPKMTGATS